MMRKDVIERLRCPSCAKVLVVSSADALACASCGTRIPIVNGTAVCATSSADASTPSDPLIFSLKMAFKRFDRLYYVLVRIIGPLFVGRKTGKNVCTALPASAFIVNLGSGPKRIAPNIVNVDIHPFDGVDVCADAAHLPFADGSVDAVLCECVLEHVPHPEDVVREIRRVLAPGGVVYASVPFMDPYHASPDDFTRWTMPGVRSLFDGFEPKELAVGWGPTSAFIALAAHWLAMLLSFGSRTLQQAFALLFMTCLAPLKLLDFIFSSHPSAPNFATGFYFIGVKR